jgi:hypothetical protein
MMTSGTFAGREQGKNEKIYFYSHEIFNKSSQYILQILDLQWANSELERAIKSSFISPKLDY